MSGAAFFPVSECVVSAGRGRNAVSQRVRGASIVNRFPYVVALSLSKRSRRHRRLIDTLERTGAAAVQLAADASNAMTPCVAAPAARLRSAYLVYETALAEPFVADDGERLYDSPWVDFHDRRIYFMEIHTIQLREDIASARTQIAWTALPHYVRGPDEPLPPTPPAPLAGAYVKPYASDYRFPARDTVAFEHDALVDGFAIKRVAAWRPNEGLTNDGARWPCFFPASLGMLASRHDDAVNIMPCGSTTVVCDRPLTIASAITYAAINDRYYPRASLAMIEASGRFTCGVPFSDSPVLEAIRFAGNSSLRDHPLKGDWVERATLPCTDRDRPPLMPWLPINLECEVTRSVRLGTHSLVLGVVRRVRSRLDRAASRMSWSPEPVLAGVARGREESAVLEAAGC